MPFLENVHSPEDLEGAKPIQIRNNSEGAVFIIIFVTARSAELPQSEVPEAGSSGTALAQNQVAEFLPKMLPKFKHSF